ncbi:MAG TPA: hypothetical protein DEF69_00095 [Barnesiella sp.]|nr:hypothetical protein [Barnesiella sp.]HBX16513.1 hypothetical protein [Barnesiella sp.]
MALPIALNVSRGEVLKGTLYLICDEQKEWATFFYFTPLALRALPLYSLTETQGERDMHHSVPAIEGIIPSLLAMSRSITGDSALAIKEYVRKGKGAAMYL